MTDIQSEELIEKIKLAFDKVEHPHQLIGDLEELGHLVDRSWDSLSLDEINATEGLTFFSREGLGYFLPAYLVTILKNPNMISDLLKNRVIRDLSQFDVVWGTWSGKLCEIFTSEQKEVIIEFLENFDILVPLISKIDTTSMTPSEREIFQIRKADRDLLLKQATEYWKACT